MGAALAQLFGPVGAELAVYADQRARQIVASLTAVAALHKHDDAYLAHPEARYSADRGFDVSRFDRDRATLAKVGQAILEVAAECGESGRPPDFYRRMDRLAGKLAWAVH